MFEALQFLHRIRDHFGDGCVVSLGIYKDGASLSVSWNDSPDNIFPFDFTILAAESVISNEIMEKLAIEHIENSHKLWEVGEI